jgi:transposase-like protein
MSETNGHDSRLDRMKEELERLHASHVRLMTDHELETKKNDRSWKRHRRWLRTYEAQREADRLAEVKRSVEIDDRITRLISGMGAFMSQGKKPE